MEVSVVFIVLKMVFVLQFNVDLVIIKLMCCVILVVIVINEKEFFKLIKVSF